MTILYIHNTDLAANNTSDTFVINNAVSLARTGATVKLLLLNTGRRDSHRLVAEKFNLDLPDTLEIVGYTRAKRSRFWYYLFLKRYIRQFNPDEAVIVTRCYNALPYLRVGKKNGLPTWFETHDFFYDIAIRDDVTDRKLKRQKTERKYFPRLAGLICLNGEQEKLYRKYLPGIPIGIFPTGLAEIFPEQQKRERLVAYVGSVDNRKGISRILALANHLKPETKILIIGGKTATEIDALRNQMEERGFGERFEITGWVDKQALHHYLGKVKVGLLPLPNTFFNRHLTVPLKIFDYLAHGIPCVCPDYPSLNGLIIPDKTGYVADWNNVESIAKSIDNLLDKPEQWAKMSREVYALAEESTWDKRARGQLAFLSN